MSHHCPIARVIPAPDVFLREFAGSDWFLWVFKNPEDFNGHRGVTTGTLEGGTEVLVLKRLPEFTQQVGPMCMDRVVTPLVKVRARHRDANGVRVTGWMLECNVIRNQE